MRFALLLGAAALGFTASAADASRLLYRAYDMNGTLHGAMLFDTDKPYQSTGYPIENGDRGYFVRSNTLSFNGRSTSSGVSPVSAFMPMSFIGEVYGSGASFSGYTPPGANRPADAQFHRPTPNGTVFDTGTFHVYEAPRTYDQPADQYVKTARVTVEDIGDETVTFFAQQRENGPLAMLAIALGDRFTTEALPNQSFSGIGRPLNAFRLTGIEGSTFVDGEAQTISSITFLENPYTTDWSAVRAGDVAFNGVTLFGGSFTDPNFDAYDTVDPTDTTGFDGGVGGWVRGERHRFVIARSLAATVAVPEPATWAAMMLGFAMLGGTLRRRDTAGPGDRSARVPADARG